LGGGGAGVWGGGEPGARRGGVVGGGEHGDWRAGKPCRVAGLGLWAGLRLGLGAFDL